MARQATPCPCVREYMRNCRQTTSDPYLVPASQAIPYTPNPALPRGAFEALLAGIEVPVQNVCTDCPELPAIAAAADRVTTDPGVGWDTGANSIAQFAGDVHVTDTFDPVPAGAVIGFKAVRTNQTDPAAILHGLYFYSLGGTGKVTIRERGIAVGEPIDYPAGTSWEIRRVGAQVTYWIDGVRIAARPALTLGPLLVNACLYAAPDSVP